MAYGAGAGAALGFTSGINAGVNMAEANTRRQAIMREQLDNKIAQSKELVEQGMIGLAKRVASYSQRTPQVENDINSHIGMFTQTARMLQQLPGGEEIGKYLESYVTANQSALLTKSEMNMREVQDAQNQLALLDQTAGKAPSGQAPIGQMPDASNWQHAWQNAPSNPATAQPVQYGGGAVPPGVPGMESGQPMPGDVGQPQVPVDPSAPNQVAQQQVSPEASDPRLINMLRERFDIPLSPYEEQIATEGAKWAYGKGRDQAAAAKKMIEKSKEGQRLLDEGMITGTGAEFRVDLAKIGNYLGLGNEETYRLAQNSEKFIAAMAGPTAAIIQDFGAGTGLSDADREFAAAAAGAKISMSEGALRDILRINAISAHNLVKDYNSQVPPEARLAVPELPPDWNKPHSEFIRDAIAENPQAGYVGGSSASAQGRTVQLDEAPDEAGLRKLLSSGIREVTIAGQRFKIEE